MVRLEETGSYAIESTNPNFNSKMVRLEVIVAFIGASIPANFNSKMVRLEGSIHDGFKIPSPISIPKWYD